MTTISIDMFTDPGCPIAYSSEPQRHQLMWHYGDQLEIHPHMIVLASNTDHYEKKGYTSEKMQDAYQAMSDKWHMPFVIATRSRVGATRPACRAIVGARRADPALAEPFRRSLAFHFFGNDGQLDEPEMIKLAGADVGISAAQVDEWLSDDAVEAELRDDMKASRSPNEAAVVLKHKLAAVPDTDGYRYTAPSMVITGPAASITTPGRQPWESLDAAVANVAPNVTRRGPAETVGEVLAWAPYALATVEIAAIREISLDEARTELQDAGATFREIGTDGLWTA